MGIKRRVLQVDGAVWMTTRKKGKLLEFFLLCVLRKKAEQRGEIKSIVLTLLIKEMREKKRRN